MPNIFVGLLAFECPVCFHHNCHSLMFVQVFLQSLVLVFEIQALLNALDFDITDGICIHIVLESRSSLVHLTPRFVSSSYFLYP